MDEYCADLFWFEQRPLTSEEKSKVSTVYKYLDTFVDVSKVRYEVVLLVFIPLWSTESQPTYKSVGLLEYLNALNTRPLLGVYINPKELE